MPAQREDLETAPPLDVADEQRMKSFLEGGELDDAPETKPPVVEGDNEPEEELQTTYSKEEEQEEEQPPERLEEQEQEETTDAPVDEGEQETEDVYRVRVGGEEMEVPVSELIRGYSRTADYTRKTQSLSEERRAFEQELADVRAERERNARLYEQGAAWLESIGPSEPNWEELRRTDPAEYAAQMAEHQQRREQLRLVNEERMQLQQKEFEDNQKLLAAHLKVEREKLQEALPEWKDTAVAQADMAEMGQVGVSHYGYSPEELDNVNDNRAIRVLRDAMLYRRIQAGKPQAVQRARKAPVLKPGAAPSATRKPTPSRLTRAREALKTSGSDKAAEAFFFEALQGEK